MSSAKQYNLPPSIIFDETVTVAGAYTDPTEIFNKDNVTYQVKWDGTMAGFIYVMVCSDYNKNTDIGSWNYLTLSPQPLITYGQDSWTIELNQIGSKWVRLELAPDSGEADIQVIITGKAI